MSCLVLFFSFNCCESVEYVPVEDEVIPYYY